jgi:MoaD family protein
MPVTVRIPTPLRSMTGQKAEVAVDGTSVREVIVALGKLHPELASKLADEKGKLRRYVNFFLNDQDIRDLKEADTPVKDGDTLTIMPAIAGGARRRSGG